METFCNRTQRCELTKHEVPTSFAATNKGEIWSRWCTEFASAFAYHWQQFFQGLKCKILNLLHHHFRFLVLFLVLDVTSMTDFNLIWHPDLIQRHWLEKLAKMPVRALGLLILWQASPMDMFVFVEKERLVRLREFHSLTYDWNIIFFQTLWLWSLPVFATWLVPIRIHVEALSAFYPFMNRCLTSLSLSTLHWPK